MDPTDLVDGVLRSVLGGRRKRGRRTARFLSRGTRGVTRAALSNPSALLTLAGVAWGIYETLQSTGAAAPAGGPSGAGPGRGTAGVGQPSTPPLPLAAVPGPASVPEGALRLVRLAVSVAQADGALNDDERGAILAHARSAGVEAIVSGELERPRPLPEIVAGVTDAGERATLYGAAFAVAHADEGVSGLERIYLAQLANLLGLEPATVQAIERDVAARIDAAGDDAPPTR